MIDPAALIEKLRFIDRCCGEGCGKVVGKSPRPAKLLTFPLFAQVSVQISGSLFFPVL